MLSHIYCVRFRRSWEASWIRSVQDIPSFQIDRVEATRAILGCDAFISWLYQVGASPFRRPDGTLDAEKVLEVMKASLSYGVKSFDLSPPLVNIFRRLRVETDEEITGLGALQEWTCRSFTIRGIPLENYSEEIKASICSRLPQGFLENLEGSKTAKVGFIRSFFVPARKATPLSQSQIEKISLEPGFFERRLELYKKLNLKLVQFGGIAADWLVGLGRIDLLEKLLRMIRRNGFAPLLICHLASVVLPTCEKELDGISGYIIPLNKLWSLLTLLETLEVAGKTEKPIIAMKTLAQGVLGNEIENAYTFLFKKARVSAVLVGISSKTEAEQTFSTIGKVLKEL